jgi:hypothetical protein
MQQNKLGILPTRCKQEQLYLPSFTTKVCCFNSLQQIEISSANNFSSWALKKHRRILASLTKAPQMEPLLVKVVALPIIQRQYLLRIYKNIISTTKENTRCLKDVTRNEYKAWSFAIYIQFLPNCK